MTNRPLPYRLRVHVAPSQTDKVNTVRLVPSYYWYTALLSSECYGVNIRVRDASGTVVASFDQYPGRVDIDSRRRLDLTRIDPSIVHEISMMTEQVHDAPRLQIRLDQLQAAFAAGDAGAIAQAITILSPDDG